MWRDRKTPKNRPATGSKCFFIPLRPHNYLFRTEILPDFDQSSQRTEEQMEIAEQSTYECGIVMRAFLESKAPWASSWMNSPIPSLLLPLWENESLCETIGMKICHLYIHLHAKHLAQELVLKKRQNGNSEVEVKSVYVPSGPVGQHLFQFL